MLMICKIIFTLLPTWAAATIAGISYLDDLAQRSLKPVTGENPCNPLYWYPQALPDSCYKRKANPVPSPPLPPPPIPLPLNPPNFQPPMSPVAPMPMPYPMQTFPQFPPLMYPAVPQYAPMPLMLPAPGQMPCGIASGYPLPPAPAIPLVPAPQAGFVPGVPGIVSPDGGINILPFSDAYSDMLEKHKQKQIRLRMEKVLDDYDKHYKRNYKKYN